MEGKRKDFRLGMGIESWLGQKCLQVKGSRYLVWDGESLGSGGSMPPQESWKPGVGSHGPFPSGQRALWSSCVAAGARDHQRQLPGVRRVLCCSRGQGRMAPSLLGRCHIPGTGGTPGTAWERALGAALPGAPAHPSHVGLAQHAVALAGDRTGDVTGTEVVAQAAPPSCQECRESLYSENEGSG